VAHAVALAACGDLPVKTTEVESALPRQAAAIVVGQTDRAQARGQLGEPWLASDHWRFDLFRMSGKNVDVGFLFLPWPVPFGVSSDEVRAYVLVGYDANGVVSAVDSGATHGEDSSWQVPAGGGDSILLAAGAVEFAVESSSHTPSVLVPVARRDQYLATLRAGDGCTVLVGCGQDQCSNALVVDGGEPRPMPGVLTRIQTNPGRGIEVLTQPWLAPLALRPGRHRLQVPPKAHTTLEATAEFSCGAGELLYAVIRIEPGDKREAWRHWKTQEQGSISVSQQMPERFRDLPMLIWRDGTWLVAAEAER
jgi:hypothetical protein